MPDDLPRWKYIFYWIVALLGFLIFGGLFGILPILSQFIDTGFHADPEDAGMGVLFLCVGILLLKILAPPNSLLSMAGEKGMPFTERIFRSVAGAKGTNRYKPKSEDEKANERMYHSLDPFLYLLYALAIAAIAAIIYVSVYIFMTGTLPPYV